MTSVFDKDGYPAHAVGVVENIDREKEMEHMLAQGGKHLQHSAL